MLVLVPILKREPFAAPRVDPGGALRFRLVVWGAIGVLLTTGPLLVLGRGWSLGEPDGWPGMLFVKLMLVAVVLGLTVAHDFFIAPASAGFCRYRNAPGPPAIVCLSQALPGCPGCRFCS